VRRVDRHVWAAAVVSGVLLGCGDADTDRTRTRTVSPAALTDAERRLVATYEGRIQEHCVRVARSLADPRAAPSPRQQRRALEAADALGALATRKPTAEIDAGQDLRLFLSDVIENLEGSNCDPRMRARLEEALSAIPVE
jgi:hypothetical protein